METNINSILSAETGKRIIQVIKSSFLRKLSDMHYRQRKEFEDFFSSIDFSDIWNKQANFPDEVHFQANEPPSLSMMLLELYAKFMPESCSSKRQKKRRWKAITSKIKKTFPFECNSLQCRQQINKLKHDYERNKNNETITQEMANFLRAARNAFETTNKSVNLSKQPSKNSVKLPNKNPKKWPWKSPNKYPKKCSWKLPNYYSFLEILVRYKIKLSLSKGRDRELLFRKISEEMTKICQIHSCIQQCKHEVHRLKNFYEKNKNKDLKGVKKRLFQKVKEAFETENSGYSMTKTCSDSVENSSDANKVELLKNKSSNVQGVKVNSNPSMKKVTPSRGSHQITIQRNRHEVITNTAAKLNDSVVDEKVKSFCLSENETEEDNDGIIICTPPRQKIPPLIDLDNDLEFGIIPLSNTSAMKSASCSTSVDFYSEENFNFRINLDDCDNIYKQTIIFTDHISHEDTKNNEKKGGNVNVALSSEKTDVGRKQKFNSNNSNDDYNKTVNCVEKPAFIGPIQSSSYNSTSNLQLTTLNNQIGNLEKEDISQTDSLPFSVECNSKDRCPMSENHKVGKGNSKSSLSAKANKNEISSIISPTCQVNIDDSAFDAQNTFSSETSKNTNPSPIKNAMLSEESNDMERKSVKLCTNEQNYSVVSPSLKSSHLSKNDNKEDGDNVFLYTSTESQLSSENNEKMKFKSDNSSSDDDMKILNCILKPTLTEVPFNNTSDLVYTIPFNSTERHLEKGDLSQSLLSTEVINKEEFTMDENCGVEGNSTSSLNRKTKKMKISPVVSPTCQANIDDSVYDIREIFVPELFKNRCSSLIKEVTSSQESIHKEYEGVKSCTNDQNYSIVTRLKSSRLIKNDTKEDNIFIDTLTESKSPSEDEIELSLDNNSNDDDDYIKLVDSIIISPLTGVVQTFPNENASTFKNVTPLTYSMGRHPEKGDLSQTSVSTEVINKEDNFTVQVQNKNGHKCSSLCPEKCPWENSDYKIFLQILAKHNTELSVPEIKRKKSLFREVAQEMTEKCQRRCTVPQCRHEIHRLKIFYENNRYKNLKGVKKRLFHEAQKVFENPESRP